MLRALFLFTAALALVACNNSDTSTSKAESSTAVGCYVPPIHDRDWYSTGKKAPRFEGLEGIQFSISTELPEAQDYFNQGMMLAYGFNHAEAARSFFEASRIDSTCVMAYWGFAYVLGPNYNAGMESDNYERAFAAVSKAKSLLSRATAREAALIEALQTRYSPEPPADRSPLDQAYSAAMKKLYDRYPNDPDIGALYAESLMNLHPWDLYDKNSKQPRAWTPGIVQVLERLVQQHPTHAGVHHFYIHAMETSATPEKALASAYLLDTLVRGAGHLVHMPSHIYINTGDYHQGTLSNIRASAVDSNYSVACNAQGAYPLAYYPHNDHFLVATATLEGNADLAWRVARKLQTHTHQQIMRSEGWGTLQHYYTIPYYVGVKLSMWDSLLSLPAPAVDLLYPRAIWHYARGMAFAGQKKLAAAEKEWEALDQLAADSSLKHLSVWNINTMADLAQIAREVLAAAIAVQKKQGATAVEALQRAVAMEDALNYNEPPDWFFSVRHHLGAVLLQMEKPAEAEAVFRQDLRTWRRNGWALLGLSQALAMQGKRQEAEDTRRAFEEAWKFASFRLDSPSGVTD